MSEEYVDHAMGLGEWTSQSSIMISAQSFIVVFKDDVSKALVEKHANDIIANGKDISFGLKLQGWYVNPSYRIIGGEIKDRYYQSSAGINVRLKLKVYPVVHWQGWLYNLYFWSGVLCLYSSGVSRIFQEFPSWSDRLHWYVLSYCLYFKNCDWLILCRTWSEC